MSCHGSCGGGCEEEGDDDAAFPALLLLGFAGADAFALSPEQPKDVAPPNAFATEGFAASPFAGLYQHDLDASAQAGAARAARARGAEGRTRDLLEELRGQGRRLAGVEARVAALEAKMDALLDAVAPFRAETFCAQISISPACGAPPFAPSAGHLPSASTPMPFGPSAGRQPSASTTLRFGSPASTTQPASPAPPAPPAPASACASAPGLGPRSTRIQHAGASELAGSCCPEGHGPDCDVRARYGMRSSKCSIHRPSATSVSREDVPPEVLQAALEVVDSIEEAVQDNPLVQLRSSSGDLARRK